MNKYKHRIDRMVLDLDGDYVYILEVKQLQAENKRLVDCLHKIQARKLVLKNQCESDIERLQAENKKLKNLNDLSKIHKEMIESSIERIFRLGEEIKKLKKIAELALDVHTRDPVNVKAKWGVCQANAEQKLVEMIEALEG